ncbi:hypothetical protein CKA32_006747 [Geitlerinema sp. FC II]|uniref:hypothetical protein n=1 Tax=Baaleninema simplex TaxID=2862350 RepID=UPI0003450C7B|nr:hypothetical protein CKA32_006747 [Geitlerinema sp. FC II]
MRFTKKGGFAVNAAEQAKDFQIASKIAAVVNVFKGEFPDLRSDLKPWTNDPETREMLDPDSIDMSFHFPGYSFRCHSRSILIQIRFHTVESEPRAIGVEVAGFSGLGRQWVFSTIENWQFVGKKEPVPDVQEKLKHCCRQTLEIFNRPNESLAS